MGLDISGLRRAAVSLSGKQQELNILRASLVQYKANISSAWVGQDASRVIDAIDLLIAKIDRTKSLMRDGASRMNGAASKQQVIEAQERAARDMKSI